MNHTTNDSQEPVEYGYCHCGCGEKTRLAPKTITKRGHTRGEPYRFVYGHSSRGINNPRSRPLEGRFWEKVTVRGPDDCWLWAGTKNGDGYGGIKIDGKTQKAHRVAWELTNGPIPKGLHCLHRCDQPACCNPFHIFLGTHSDNMDDMMQKGRHKAAVGSEQGSTKLIEQDILRIRELHDSGMPGTEISRMFEVTEGNIYHIVHRRSWTHI